ncbi:MAG: type IV secretory system conjugative DNA transfer family protein [Vampirovibrionales bacterium]|nr:type IV secretory system conjugative DNA transfer family protein [Vampirovibrionales bacterium]
MKAKARKTYFKQDMISLGFLLLVLNMAATQFVAWRFHYHPGLGKPWLHLFQTPWYAPWSWLQWRLDFAEQGKLTFALLNFMLFIAVIVIVWSAVSVIGMRSRQSKQYDDLYGSAHWASKAEIESTGLLSKSGEEAKGVYVGSWIDNHHEQHFLRHDGPEHVAAIAPTRSGKGVGLVIPTLLTWEHSVVIHDMKGELWALTAGKRQRDLNNIVLKFDPAAAYGGCSFNPLEEVRLNTPYEVGDVQNLVTIIVDPDGKGLMDHWAKTAHAFLTGVVLYLLHQRWESTSENETASLADVALALSDPQTPIDTLYEAMIDNRLGSIETQKTIAAAGRDMLNRPAQERGSVLSSAMSHLSLYRDPLVAKNIQKSAFRISDLMNYDKPVSLYLVVRPADKDRLKPLMRLILNQIIRVLARDEIKVVEGMGQVSYKHRLLLMLDEFPSFGRLEVFQEALAFLAGYGIKAYLIMQDITQLHEAYGKYESILSNCHVTVAYAPNNMDTATWLSSMLGTQTMVIEDISMSGKRVGGYLQNVSTSYKSIGRPLLLPDECRTLKGSVKEGNKIVQPGQMLIFTAGHAPILGTQILYFTVPWFLEASKIPAPKSSDSIVSRKQEKRFEAKAFSAKPIVTKKSHNAMDEDPSNTHQFQEAEESQEGSNSICLLP